MTKTTARILALICALGTLIILFQVRFISPEQGKHVFIYSVPGQRSVESEAGQALTDQLTERHGSPTDTAVVGTMNWQGREAQVLERVDHEIGVMGSALDGSRYFSCTVRTTRNAVREEDGEPKLLGAGDHALTYIALDPPGEGEARILWDSLQVEDSRRWPEFRLPQDGE